MSQSIKLDDTDIDIARREAALQSRSLAGQVTHWMRIGRAIEQSKNFDYSRITAALEGKLDTTELTESEGIAWSDAFAEKMTHPGEGEEEFFANRRRLGLGADPL